MCMCTLSAFRASFVNTTTQMQKFVGLEQLNAMKVASLRDLLKTERVDTSGTKSELVS